MDPSSSSSSSSSLLSCLSKRKMDPDSFEDEPICKTPKNDVFISYSFEDIGNGFISHLRGALRHNSFTISDHTCLPVGHDVCLELLKAIEESEIFVVVFSSNYASCPRCLNELVHVMNCLHKFDDRKILPVFFKVEPSDVRHQQGPFMEAFHAHQANEDPDRVEKWKQALKEAGHLSGLTLQNGYDEAKFLLEIVEELEKMGSPQELHVAKHPVGIGSRAEELISTLRLDCKDHVHGLVVAVFGISGIGKTTIVKEMYNRIKAKFSVSCFLAHIHYLCQVPNWKVDLPKELISCLTRNDKFSITSNHNDGVTHIKWLVRGKKVLLVLDDVDNSDQLEALGINPTWFCNGSRIIVTTRDKRTLGNIPYATYLTRLLNRRESLNLFTRLMFTRDDTVNTKFIEEVVNHAGGLPLVLKVWSCHFKQYEREEWPSVLETLKRIPHGDVHKQLKMSYDSLTNRAKSLFLDIVCFFLPSDYDYFDDNNKNLVVKVLQDEDSGFFPNIEIQYLVDKSLVEIQESDLKLWMHYVISEMGQEIVRQENEDEPGQRTRLWIEKDVMHVLTNFLGTELVESICLVTTENVVLQVEAFRKMSNLRLFFVSGHGQISWSISSHDDQMIPLSFKKLKYMQWNWFPFKSINSIDIVNVVVLRLQDSNLQILWEGMKSLKKLRILDVSSSYYLTKTGDFYELENLEELYFEHCINLEELHNSISSLHKLTILDLSESICLERIHWDSIVKLPSLRELKFGKNNYHMYIEKHSLLQLHSLNNITLVEVDIHYFPKLPRNITSIKAYRCRHLVGLPLKISEVEYLTTLECFFCPKSGSRFLLKVKSMSINNERMWSLQDFWALAATPLAAT